MKHPAIDHATVDEYLWQVKKRLYKYGVDVANDETAPLYWYINTGRAYMEFPIALVQAKPFMIARKLHEGGSYNEAIGRIKRYLGLEA